MKAARLHEYGKPLVLEDIPIPDFQPDEILVQVKACGMCRSDVQLIDGYFRPRPCENPANFCKQSRRAKFFAIFSLPSGLRARKSEQNRSVSKRVGVFTQARPYADIRPPITLGHEITGVVSKIGGIVPCGTRS
jgi:Zn-dependent alcohol dehydrogenase